MKILIAQPRFGAIGHAAEDFLWECGARLGGKGDEIHRLPARVLRGLGVDIARETAARWAVENGMDAILFGDADCRVSVADAARLVSDCGDAAILAAPMPGRRNGRRNFFVTPPEEGPPNPFVAKAILRAMEAGKPLDCRGTVGTGVCVVPVASLKRITRPWFIRGDSVALLGARMLETADHPWDDSWYSYRAAQAGLARRVHLGVRSGEHWDGSLCWRADGMLDRWKAELLAPAPEAAKP